MYNVLNERTKEFIRHNYAWPGGYPRYLVACDGEAICHTCTKDNARLILCATRAKDRSGWQAAGIEINYEDGALFCCNCNARIESAYAEPENK